MRLLHLVEGAARSTRARRFDQAEDELDALYHEHALVDNQPHDAASIITYSLLCQSPRISIRYMGTR